MFRDLPLNASMPRGPGGFHLDALDTPKQRTVQITLRPALHIPVVINHITGGNIVRDPAIDLLPPGTVICRYR